MYEKDLVHLTDMRHSPFGDTIRDHSKPVVHRKYEPHTIARFAMDVADRWGMIATIPDGEDSAGRQQMRLATPEELAARACEAAQALWNEFSSRGWFFEAPLPIPEPKKERETA